MRAEQDPDKQDEPIDAGTPDTPGSPPLDEDELMVRFLEAVQAVSHAAMPSSPGPLTQPYSDLESLAGQLAEAIRQRS